MNSIEEFRIWLEVRIALYDGTFVGNDDRDALVEAFDAGLLIVIKKFGVNLPMISIRSRDGRELPPLGDD